MDRLTAQLGHSPERLVVFRALQLGDLLVAVPFFRALRRSFPRARVALIGLPWAREFVRRFSEYLDAFIEFTGHPQLPEHPATMGEFTDFAEQIRQKEFDVAIQLHGSGQISNGIVETFEARAVCGFYDAFCPRTHSTLFAPYPSGNEIVRNLKLLEWLRLPTCGEHLELPLHEEDWHELEDLCASFEIDRDYVCIHPGARFQSRRWPAERFAQIADRLFDAGFQIVLTGSADERVLAAEVSRWMSRPHRNLAGETSLGAFGALVSRARLLVTNDTGASHVAAAVGTSSVVIVLGSDLARWAPLDRRLHRVVFQPIECRPCEHRLCPIGHPCATLLSAENVLEAAFQQLTAVADLEHAATAIITRSGDEKPIHAVTRSARATT